MAIAAANSWRTLPSRPCAFRHTRALFGCSDGPRPGLLPLFPKRSDHNTCRCHIGPSRLFGKFVCHKLGLCPNGTEWPPEPRIEQLFGPLVSQDVSGL